MLSGSRGPAADPPGGGGGGGKPSSAAQPPPAAPPPPATPPPPPAAGPAAVEWVVEEDPRDPLWRFQHESRGRALRGAIVTLSLSVLGSSILPLPYGPWCSP